MTKKIHSKNRTAFEQAFKKYVENYFPKTKEPAQNLLRRSLLYSLLGKASRFRPGLSIATAKILNQNPKKIFPWAMLVEIIHCASLIHDDLPLMDNAKTRRGKKTNHLKFGGDIALLAGSCLFVEGFYLLSSPVFDKKRSQLLKLVTSKVGFKGLMSGQALDLREKQASKKKILKINQLKTGSLIELAIKGPLTLWQKDKKTNTALTKYSQHLGLAYQLADDIKDKGKNLYRVKELNLVKQKALIALNPLGPKAEELRLFIQKLSCESILKK